MNTTVHGELTADGNRIILMAAGPIEDIAYTARQLGQLTPLIKQTDPKGALACPLSWPAVVQLSSIYGDAWRPGPRLAEWTREQIAARMAPADASPLSVPIPDSLTPRPYQIEGAHVIARTGRALIFDEPRTGKTITTILGLAEAAGVGCPLGGSSDDTPDPWDQPTIDLLPILVICPASVVDPWLKEFRLWAPYWRAVAWRGGPAKRKALIGTADVYVTSYDTARADARDTNPNHSPLIALNPAALVTDECHFVKNPSAARTQAVGRIARNVKAFVALSGTPITHHPADLWPTLVALAPNAWPARERWIKRYCLTVEADYGKPVILGLNPGTDPEYRLTILGQHRRVARADVMSQLPPKVYSVRGVELPPAHREAYDDFERTMLAELPDGGGTLSVMEVLSKFTLLSAMASAPADVEYTFGPDVDENTGELKRHVHLELKAPSWKVDALLEILTERPGEQVAAFAPSAQLMRLAGRAAEQAGYRVGYIIGGQSQKVRTANREAFQAGELDLICCTTGAGGAGITLSAAGTLVFLQRPWSIVDSVQAEDRGEGDMDATRGTEIIDVVAADSIDSRVREVLRGRAHQLADLLQDPRIVTELLGGASIRQLRKAS